VSKRSGSDERVASVEKSREKGIEEREMKTVVTRTLIALAGVVLVLPFVAGALLVGARALNGAESTEHNLMLVALAFGAALFGGVRNLVRPAEIERERSSSLHIAPKVAHGRPHAFLGTHGL